MMVSWKSLVAGIVFGVLTTLGAGVLLWHRSPTDGAAASSISSYHVDGDSVRVEPRHDMPLRFDTAPVEVGPALPRTPVTARVETIESLTAPSYAPLEGRVAQVAVRLGQKVTQGARLVLVRSGELAGMKRELRASQLAIKTRQAMLDRTRLLVESRAAPQNDLLVAESELAESKLAERAAGAKLGSLSVQEQDDNHYWVLATRAGIVVQLDASPGKEVGPDKDKPVATVADLDEVLVLGDLPQWDARGLAAGVTAQVRAPGGGPALPGRVELVSDVVDPDRQTVPIRIRVKNPEHQLRAHAFVEATFAAEGGAEVLQVPADAVVSDGPRSVVFVETAPGTYKRRAVRVGHRTRDRVELLEGVAPGDRVVVKGALLLLNAVDLG